jgi:hypothetical protein
MYVDAILLFTAEELVTGLFRKNLEIAHRSAIGGEYAQAVACDHPVEGPLGLEQGHGTLHIPGIHFLYRHFHLWL